ncbi:hypothetical protein [Yoonia sp.]|uniref:hypothetical protein n=1 Tax=Yoonia sp. TaxID=2212373 RepID=UPI002DFC3324|nr:hypothetical protein [Yoonia sp.]
MSQLYLRRTVALGLSAKPFSTSVLCRPRNSTQPQPEIARWLNRAMLAGRVDLDALTVARRLLTIERQLAQIIEAARRC